MSIIITEILEREFMGVDGEFKKLKHIINAETDTYILNENKIVFKKEATLKLRKHVGAVFLKPEFIDVPSPYNDKEYTVICTVKFLDGEVNYEIGSANNLNSTGLAKKIKSLMAYKRGCARAFLTSNQIGLFEVYDEEESEDFKSKPRDNHQNQTEEQNSLNQNSQEKDIMESDAFPPTESLYLPLSDSKYPGKHIIDDVMKINLDFDYFDVILKNYPDNHNYINAISFVKKKTKELQSAKFIIEEYNEPNGDLNHDSEELDEIGVNNHIIQQQEQELLPQESLQQEPEQKELEKEEVSEIELTLDSTTTDEQTRINNTPETEPQKKEINNKHLSDAEDFLNSINN